MAVLIIGAGLIGSQIARILVERGERPVLMDHAPQREALGEIVAPDRVELIEGDVLQPFSLTRAITQHGIDAIIHTAANPLLTLGAQRDPYAAIQLNIMGSVNVFEAARLNKLRRVVVSSSSVLNSYMAGGAAKGDLRREEALPRPTTFYAATKQAVENIGLNYARHCGLDIAAVRYGAVAGPWSGRGGGGPSNIFRQAVEHALSGEEAVVPASSMEWVYSKDAAEGTVAALTAKELGSRVFNISMGHVTPAEEFAAALKTVLPQARVRIETPAAAATALQNMPDPADLSLARELLGFRPKYRIEDAIRDMAGWYRANRRA